MTERGDRSKLPPGPWSWEDNGLAGRPLGHGHVYLLDRNGRKIAAIWGRPEEKIAIADFIVEARDAAMSGTQGGRLTERGAVLLECEGEA